MSDEKRELWVNTQFKGPQLDEFLVVKEYLGIETNTDVVRHLIRKQARAIRRSVLPPPSPDPQLPDSPLPPSPPPQPLDADLEALCLSCSLPDCDESDPRCAYQQATGQRQRKRAQMRTYMRRRRAATRGQARGEERDGSR